MTLSRLVPIVLIALAACGGRAPAPVAGPAPDTTPPAPPMRRDTNPRASLYHRLGGIEAITAVVDNFVARITSDPRISAFFAGLDMRDIKAKLVAQFCNITRGGCRYYGRSMREAHADLDIKEQHFNALVEDLIAALDHFQVPEQEKNELLALLAPMKRDIVR
ncbi:MAG: group I truncated hemoglobin [Gemmatimonadales bacterium]